MDFTQMPVSQGYKYLLVMIDTFPGWIEGFPTHTEKAEEVVKNKQLDQYQSATSFAPVSHFISNCQALGQPLKAA